MKKFFIAFIVIFISFSASAYQQRIYVDPFVGYAGTTVTINATCSYLKFSSFWYTFLGTYNAGSSVAYSGSTLIGEHSWWTGHNSPSYNSLTYSGIYWGTITMYMASTNCYGESKLEWEL